MKSLIVYSSLTGNTKAVAEAIREAMPEGTEIYSLKDAPAPDAYDFLALGFWVNKASPAPDMLEYMRSVTGKTVGLFGTLAAWPDSPHAKETAHNAEAALAGNRVLGCFLCQGRLTQKRFDAIMSGTGAHAAKHPLTEERKTRLIEASRHPNEDDFSLARQTFQEFLRLYRKG